MEPPVSSSRGPMGSLLWKLDWLESQRFLRNPVRKTFELLKEDLVGIDTFLLELSDEDDPNLMKKYWMKEVREICYDTEDYIDWLFHSQLKIGSVGVAPRLKISRLPRTLNPRPNIASQIKELRVRLQDASERHKRYVLDNNTTSPSSNNFMHSHWIPEWSREAASLLVGIDDSKEKLIKLLNNGEKQLNVISISGLGGIGKTTLARQILQELGWQFGCHAFVRASRKPDTRSLLRSILSQTGWRHHLEACNLQQLIEHLSEHLRHRRYLIVIDDLWDTAVWDFLLCAFPDGTQSSRIITTTASENVAMTCCGNRSDYILKMEPLNDDDSRKLFCARVFGSEDKCPQQLKDASCEIVRKCGGVPLAIIHISGLLTRQQDKSEEWDYVERSLGSNLRISPTYEGMRKVINLSYNGLSQCLKTCLQYVSMYPENCTIWKDDLVRRWVAEGFIERDGERDNEEIAQSHFEELVYRGMIQAIDMNYNDQVLSCIVHTMVLDFVTNKSAEDNFVTTVDYSQSTRELSSKVRRLFLFYHTAKYAAKLSGITLLQVRSLAFYGLVKCLPSIREFQFLRVLVLHLWGDYNDPTILNLSGINRLFQLRYLKVTCNYFLQLPTHMSGLHRLETMEINAKVTSFPEDIVYLKYLVHLSLPRETKLPYGVGRLRSLRTLKCFDFCGNSDDEVKSLQELSCLEELQLVLTTAPFDSVDRNMKVLFSILGYFCKLKSLVLFRGASVPKDSVYITDSSSMSYPNSTEYLERLEFHQATCIFRSVPEWIGALQNLRTLKLGVLEIQKNDVESLAGLQMLIFLSLYVQRPTAYQIVFNSGAFPALKCFKFRSRELCVAFRPGAMPELRRLKLSFVAYSHMLDGIEHLLNLQEVSGRIGADVGAKECDTRMTESAFKNAIRRHSMIPRINIQIVDWIEDDHVPAKNIILSKTKQVDHGIPGKESEDNTNKKAHTRTSTIPDAVVNFSEVPSSEFFDGMEGVGPEVEEAPGHGKTVCVTGAGGYIGSWIVKLLLERGYTVRGTSRNPDDEKNAHLWNLPGAADRLTLCKADLLDYDALRVAVAGCDGVFHTASPITDDPVEMFEPAVRGTYFVLLAAADAATVRRVVVTSSIGAVVLDPNRSPDTVVIDESCWSDAEFCKKTRNWYCYAKMIAELKAWDMARQHRVDLVVVIPGLTLGRALQLLPDSPRSFSHVLRYLDGSAKSYANAVQLYVHVRDVAEAHVRVFEAPKASGRYLCGVSVLHRKDVVTTLHKYFPEYPVPERCSDEVNPMKKPYKISNQRLRELGMEFTSAEQALYETVRYFQEKGILPEITPLSSSERIPIPWLPARLAPAETN